MKEFKAKTKGQAEYIRSISENIVTICTGPAGTGKTSVAAAMACQYLYSSKIKKIIVTRPTIDTGKGIGYLPGTATEKINPYMIPIMEEFEKYIGESVKDLLEKKTIEITPIDYCRGRNWHDCFVIIDEASNATFSQLQMLISRIGSNSKIVIQGDPDQTDLKLYDSGGLEFLAQTLDGYDHAGVIKLTHSDIIRNKKLSQIIGTLTNENFQTFQRERRDKDKVE